MKLTKIYFDAFKSLLNKELEIKYDCVGFVGTNESGKSNVLSAINVLSSNRKLTSLDTPKMSKSSNPSLRFQFKLDENENKEITTLALRCF
ncbi:MAG: AAA family ATPase [Minisyncoccia bacterium]